MELISDFNTFLFNGNIDAAGRLLERGIDINKKEENGNYAMSAAINSDNPEVLNFIIRNGADVNLKMDNGTTGLHIAIDCAIDGMIQNNREEPYQEAMQMIKMLLDNGADLTIKDTDGETALDVINTYSGNITGFNFLKDIFRTIIPDIDNRISFNK